MANKFTATRIRLPPIDGSVHDLVTGFSLNKTDSEKRRNVLARQQNIPDYSGFFPPLVQPAPSRQQVGSHSKRKSLRHPPMKITHTEKVPTQFPGKRFAVLPPIGGSRCQEKNDSKPSDENPSSQPTAGMARKPAKQKAVKKTESSESKVSNSEFNSTSTVNNSIRVVKKQMSALGLANGDRKQEYKVQNNSPDDPQMPLKSKAKASSSHSPTNAERFHQHSDLQNDDDGNDGDDDESTMMKLFEVLQFLEWSSELREFLNGTNSARRNATCTSIDPVLSHAVDVIRDILLKQTMEELCMMW